jgi:hypothetical protein
MCVGFEETRWTGALVAPACTRLGCGLGQRQLPIKPSLEGHACIRHTAFPGAGHASRGQRDMAMLNWDADYEMSGDEEEGLDIPNGRSTMTNTSPREVS